MDEKNKGFRRSLWKRRGFWIWLSLVAIVVLLVTAILSLVTLYSQTPHYLLSNNSECLAVVIFCVVVATALFCLVNEKSKSFWRSSWKWRRGFRVWLSLLTIVVFLVAAVISLVAFFVPTTYYSPAINYLPSNNSDCLAVVIFCVASATALFCLVIFIRWLCCWRNIRRFLWGLACLAVLIALFYVEEDWRGKHAWKKYRREWEAKGEHFDLASFVPPAVPDDQNFALAPIVVSCYAEWLDGRGHRIEPPNTSVINRLEMKISGHEEWHEWFTNADGDWRKVTKINLPGWQHFYRAPVNTNWDRNATNEFPVAAKPQTPANDVLLALSKYDSALEELRAAANQRPLSRFPLNYENELPDEILLPHHYYFEDCALVLQLRAAAELEDNQSKRALADIKLMVRLIDSIRTEPFLFSHVARIRMAGFTVQPIWEGLAGHKWSEAQLADLEQALGKLDFISDYQFAMRDDRACDIATIKYMRRNRSHALNCIRMITHLGRDDRYYPPLDMDRPLPFMAVLVPHLVPSGWFYQNEITIARMYQPLLPILHGTNETILVDAMRHAESASKAEREHLSPYNVIALMLGDHIEFISKHFAFAQSSLNLARLACALERYRLMHGEYPETLDTLAPQFIEKLPHDVINGQPLHYRRTDDGQFVLYSVGWNETDDGGVVGFYKNSGTVNINIGDWVWRYPSK